MIRTRDYFLMILIIVFLLVGIGTTLISRLDTSSSSAANAVLVVPESESYGVQVVDEEVERKNRLADMRQKIAQSDQLVISEPEPIEEETETIDEQIVSEVLLCNSYQVYAGAWNSTGLQFDEVEGLRFVYRNKFVVASTSASTTHTSVRETVLSLPVRSVALGGKFCLESDVVGITLGGTLLRNDQAALYKAAGSEVLIGYALDGYPIYGVSGSPGDACGGQTAQGLYRYTLDLERDTILNCYVGKPTAF